MLKYSMLLPHLNEKEKRLVLSSDALSFGRGGLSLVAKASGVSRVTLNAGLKDLKQTVDLKVKSANLIRRQGGGRKKCIY